MSYNKGMLLVISGPSGAGKGTVLGELLKTEDFALSISATSRKPRKGEREGVNYFYKTEREFAFMIANNELFEYAKYSGNYYGTPKKYVIDQVNSGKDIILEVEVQGAIQVKASVPEAILVFITPKTVDELKARLLGRGTETDEQMKIRIDTALNEIEYINCYDYVIINDTVDKATEELKNIISAEKEKVRKNNNIIKMFKGEE